MRNLRTNKDYRQKNVRTDVDGDKNKFSNRRDNKAVDLHKHTRVICAMPRFHMKSSAPLLPCSRLSVGTAKRFGAHHLINCETLPLKRISHTHMETH